MAVQVSTFRWRMAVQVSTGPFFLNKNQVSTGPFFLNKNTFNTIEDKKGGLPWIEPTP
jgi:hypothetical protein